MNRLRPDLVWRDGRFQRDLAVEVDPATGRITDVSAAGDDDAERLPDRALIPGFVNAHSHAFQRLIRGRTQWRPASGPDAAADFWSWRDAMYGAALSLSDDDVYHVARFCFLEMLRTGITTVGEFHYLHHAPDGRPYDDPNRLARRVIAAARDVGLRIRLLNVCYAAGGIGRPLDEAQRRFRADSAAGYLERTAGLIESEGSAAGGMVGIGVAPHSIRAVPREWLPTLAAFAAERDLPLHMHVAEQPAEVEACVAAYGLRPVELLARDGLLDGRFTAVHATHLTDGEVARLGEAGAYVCGCPTTERDLGDGFLRGLDLRAAGVPICLGTDSHTSLDFLEEMRLIEYHERLRRGRRVVITEPAGGAAGAGRLEVAPPLLAMGTIAGARSLRLDAGEIAGGRLADLVAIDLRHPALAGWTDGSLAAMIVLSATPDVVSDVWVGGRRRLVDRRHPADADAAAAFRAVAAR